MRLPRLRRGPSECIFARTTETISADLCHAHYAVSVWRKARLPTVRLYRLSGAGSVWGIIRCSVLSPPATFSWLQTGLGRDGANWQRALSPKPIPRTEPAPFKNTMSSVRTWGNERSK